MGCETTITKIKKNVIYSSLVDEIKKNQGFPNNLTKLWSSYVSFDKSWRKFPTRPPKLI